MDSAWWYWKFQSLEPVTKTLSEVIVNGQWPTCAIVIAFELCKAASFQRYLLTIHLPAEQVLKVAAELLREVRISSLGFAAGEIPN